MSANPPKGVAAHPLQWPAGRPRTPASRRARSKFDDKSFAVVRDNLFHELKLLGARNVVLSTNVELRNDGLPYSGRRQPDDVGVAVYFTHKGKQVCFACDRWQKIEDNLIAVTKTIEAIRGIDRWGTGEMVDAAFQGFAALPPGPVAKPWWEVMGVSPGASINTVAAQYRALSMERHPDRGGSQEAMAELNRAYADFNRISGL